MPNFQKTNGWNITSATKLPSFKPTFLAYRKNITFKLRISNDDIVKYSIGGFIIGHRGSKIQNFITAINNEHAIPGQKQFLRIRLLGKLFHCKTKNKGRDQHKRHGASRVELCFAVYTPQHQAAIWGITKKFEQILDDMMVYYQWAKSQDRLQERGQLPCKFNEEMFLLAKDDFLASARNGKVPGLDICDDLSGKLIVSVKGGKYDIEEKESNNLQETDDDFSFEQPIKSSEGFNQDAQGQASCSTTNQRQAKIVR